MYDHQMICVAATYDPHTEMYEFSFMSAPVKPKKVKKTAKPEDFNKEHGHHRALIFSKNDDYAIGQKYLLSLLSISNG